MANPALARLQGSSAADVRRTLVIAGFPRSGTTWIAEMIATIPRSGIVFEPLNIRKVPEARAAGFAWENFKLPHEEWEDGEAFLHKVLTGQVLNSWTAAHMPLRRAIGVDRWIIKFVGANQILGWMVANFQIPPPVLVVRHPCAVYASWLRRGWPIYTRFSSRDRFFEVHPEFSDYVKKLTRQEEIFASRWSMKHYTAFEQLEPGEYQLCCYERVVRDGASEIGRLIENWGLPRPSGLDASFGRPSSKASGALATGSVAQLGSWRKDLDSTTVERMSAVVREFGLDFYGTDPEPDYHRLPRDVGRADPMSDPKPPAP